MLLLLAAWASWRWAMVLTGVLGLAWTWLWSRHAPARPSPRCRRRRRRQLAGLLRNRGVLQLVLASALGTPLLFFCANWAPTVISRQGQASGVALAMLLVVVYASLDLGYLTGGALASGCARWLGAGGARVLVAVLAPLPMAALLLVPRAGSPTALTAALAVACLGVGWFMVTLLAGITDLGGPGGSPDHRPGGHGRRPFRRSLDGDFRGAPWSSARSTARCLRSWR